MLLTLLTQGRSGASGSHEESTTLRLTRYWQVKNTVLKLQYHRKGSNCDVFIPLANKNSDRADMTATLVTVFQNYACLLSISTDMNIQKFIGCELKPKRIYSNVVNDSILEIKSLAMYCWHETIMGILSSFWRDTSEIWYALLDFKQSTAPRLTLKIN